jgi:hypothetical protein
MYVKCNIEALSCNDYCRGKSINTTYSECSCSLSYLTCKYECAILPSMAGPTLQYFSHFLIKIRVFKKEVIEYKMCVLIFSTLLSETFLILRRNERDLVKNVYWSSCKVNVMHPDFNETWAFWSYFRKTLKYEISWKSFIKHRVVPCGRTYVQTWRS